MARRGIAVGAALVLAALAYGMVPAGQAADPNHEAGATLGMRLGMRLGHVPRAKGHRAERMPINVIARTLGCSKNTVRAAIRDDSSPGYVRAPSESLVDQVEPRIRELLAAWPTMPAMVIAERVGWQHSIRLLSARVAELRPVYLPPDPASRTTY